MESLSPATKLDMDMHGASRLRGRMEELDDRVAALCIWTGMLMKDASVEAVKRICKASTSRKVGTKCF